MPELKIGTIIQDSRGRQMMITGIDKENQLVYVRDKWISINYVNEYFEIVT